MTLYDLESGGGSSTLFGPLTSADASASASASATATATATVSPSPSDMDASTVQLLRPEMPRSALSGIELAQPQQTDPAHEPPEQHTQQQQPQQPLPAAVSEPIDLTADSDSDSAPVSGAQGVPPGARAPGPLRRGAGQQWRGSGAGAGASPLNGAAIPEGGPGGMRPVSGGGEGQGGTGQTDGQGQGNAQGQDKDDSDDEFTITASTGPTRPSAARRPWGTVRGAGARTQGSLNGFSPSGVSLHSQHHNHHPHHHHYHHQHQHQHQTPLSHPHSHSHSQNPSHIQHQHQHPSHPHAHHSHHHHALPSTHLGPSPLLTAGNNGRLGLALVEAQRQLIREEALGIASTSTSASTATATATTAASFSPSPWPSNSHSGTPTPAVPSVPALPGASSAYGDGSAAAPIDVDKVPHRPARPRPPAMSSPICIGGFMSRAIMLYPKTAVTAGEPGPPGSTDVWDVVNYRGVEMLRVKLKLRKAGSIPRPDEPWSATNVDTIQVLTPGMGTYIGDLDPHTSEVIIPMLKRGLCRLEGFAVRIPKEAAQYECKVNVLIFTLPSNTRYISDILLSHSLFLLDPLPPYDPARHTDNPEYVNAHGSGERALELYTSHRRAQASTSSSSFTTPAMDRARQVEVQRKQAEAIIDELGDGVELEQSDPGPWIRTELFPHQRKALTFLLQAEQDTKSLKEARKIGDRKLGIAKSSKKDKKDGEDSQGASSREGTAGPKDGKDKDKYDFSRSLWEGERDERGRLRVWKNKVTGEKMRLKKNERPKDAKGAILADDMGLGKTLSVVSLIAATRSAAKEWAERPLEPVALLDGEDTASTSKLDASAMSTRVFGMPDAESEVNPKKRRRDEPSEAEVSHRLRRSRIALRSKGTLLVCPMSTMTNWEDQIKEHWDGKVVVVGGGGSSVVKNENGADYDEFDTIKVYMYHGAARNMDTRFLAEFDIVITSYSTLANEFSKQCATCGDDETPFETGAANSDDEGGTGVAESSRSSIGNQTPDPEFKPAELSEALLRKKVKGGKKKPAATGEQPSALQSIDWFRVVLDEAHSIKSPSTIACRASCALEADRRVALTGTPIQNRVDDVWALFKFLRISPINEREVFTKYITTPCKTGEQVGVARLQLVMRMCTLRRTKDMMTEAGRRILDLPPRREIQIWLDLRPDERTIYDERHDEIKKDILELKAKKQLTKNYAHVLQHLLRLRQTCDHVDLPSSGPVEEDYDGTIMDYELACVGIDKYGVTLPRAQSVLSFNKDTPEGAVCAECKHDFGPLFPSIGLGGAEDDAPKPAETDGKKAKKPVRPVLTKCLHVLCPTCFKRSVYAPWPKKTAGVSRACGVCERMLRVDIDVLEVSPPNSDEQEDQPKKVVRRKKWARKDGEDLSLSTKMEWLREDLMRHSRLNPNSANADMTQQLLGHGEPRDMPFCDAEGNGFDSVNYDENGYPMASKGIIFSQWTTMLDRIEDMLIELNINYTRLDGTMTREQRAQAMDDLRTKKSVEVMLVSTRAGGVGLNLTSACRAYLVDPYWNPSVEAQAIDRVHRMGQKMPVTAVRLMIKNSVEEKLHKIQVKKASLANLSLKKMSRKELMEQKAEDLVDLFS